ncbi:MAG TPA: hypothetical protein VFB13_05155 [Reyranella sp.]|jgi:pyocin large subunit-like protein|nr:hypothetical protein [Reyranella sp.]
MEGRLTGLPWHRLLLGMLAAMVVVASWSQAREPVGFTTARHLDEHYEKHGREFGTISKHEYLALAQALRDAPAGGPIEEIVRKDGVVTRFDRASGAFIAFNPDRTIRTFFKPNDGERYFRRQAARDDHGASE